MLEGITVLNQSAAIDFNAELFFIIFFALVIGAAFVTGLLNIDYGWGIAAVFVILIILTPIIFYTESETRKRYECLIDESVSMTEVYERYEVIEQRGDIWVLEDKE